MLMTECGPQFHPLSVPNNEDWERGDEKEKEAWRRNRNKPIGERTPASSKKSPFLSLLLPFFLFQRRSHWEPSWLDIIFSSCRLMIATQCQKLHIRCNFSTRQTFDIELFLLAAFMKTLMRNYEKQIEYIFFLNYSLYLLFEPLAAKRTQFSHEATVKQ